MPHRMPAVLVLVIILTAPLGLPCRAAPASPSRAAAEAKSGWTGLVPDLTPLDARSRVAEMEAADDRDFMEKAWGLVLQRDPETAYAYGVSSIYGVPEDELTGLSDSHALGTRALYIAIKAEVDKRLGASGGIRSEGIALKAFSRWLADKAKDIELSLDKYPVSPYVNSADQLAIDYFTEYRTIRDAAEAERWIACLALLPAKIKGLSAAVDVRGRAGIVLPRGIFEYTLQGLQEIANASPRSTPFFEAFQRKLRTAAIEDEGDRKALLGKAAVAIETYALPAWKDLAAALERQRAKVPAEGGAWRLPGGSDYYSACLARYTTMGVTADELHELGKKELGRVHAEIRGRFAALGYQEGANLKQLYDRLGAESGYSFGRGLLDRIDGHIKSMDASLGELVLERPNIGVEAVFGEMGGYYQPPSIDGDRPGRYFVAASDRRYTYDIATTVYHETIPGHHLQIARGLEADLPGFLRSADFMGFIEGWALYAERLAFEMGAYECDPAGDLGRLRMEALRAARLVADTGINAMGWGFQKTVLFLEENTGLGSGMIQSDVTRYIIDPGQATSYYAGFLRILELREKCRQALGPLFDLRRFHEALLSSGALPFDVLEKKLEDFIVAAKAG
ncbi:MAG: DUF885 domain-containing protein [Spirochaetaceae bacterium]|nr:DUF885 domain-containing protein [Spirochaetaceae bacterium]